MKSKTYPYRNCLSSQSKGNRQHFMLDSSSNTPSFYLWFLQNNRIIQRTPKLNSLFRWQSQRRTSECNALLIVVYMLTPTPQNPYNYSKVRERQREIRGLRHQFSLIRLTTLSLFLTYCSLHTLHVRLVEITVSLVYRQWFHVLQKRHAGVL